MTREEIEAIQPHDKSTNAWLKMIATLLASPRAAAIPEPPEAAPITIPLKRLPEKQKRT